MLGAFIDCDAVGGGDGSGDNKDDDENECSRWMMWAAVSPPGFIMCMFFCLKRHFSQII